MGDGLGHDGGVHDHLLSTGLLDHADTPGGLDAGCQQRLHAFFSNALSPARQAGRVNGQFGLQVGLATEELPVLVLHPGVDHRFIGCIEGVLQVQQTGHQARRQGWPAATRGERGRERALDLGPVDQTGKPDHRVLHVDLLVQPWAEQLGRLRLRRLRTHQTPWWNLQENRYWQKHTLQILRPSIRRTARQINGLRVVQGGLFIAGRALDAWQFKPVATEQPVQSALGRQGTRRGPRRLHRSW